MRVDWVEPDWPARGGVRALSTLRTGGVSLPPYASLNLGAHVGDIPSAVAENRRRLAAEAGLPAEPVWLAQVHGITVADLDARASLPAAAPAAAVASGAARTAGEASAAGATSPAVAALTADAAFTRRPGRVCAILTADCWPVLLAEESGGVVAAAHAGWRGLADGVIESTVRALRVPPGRLMAWLGPAIGPGHFEVGAEVREALLREDSGADGAFSLSASGRFMADLGMLVRRRLAALGVARIYGGGQCTHADAERYFSFRRDGVTGRQATLIWLE